MTFVKRLPLKSKKYPLEGINAKVRNRKALLSDSGIITILIAFHTGPTPI